jgi:hypothetical protein
MRKIIQFQAVPDSEIKLIALCDDGTMWTLRSYSRGWWSPVEAEFPAEEDSQPSPLKLNLDVLKQDQELERRPGDRHLENVFQLMLGQIQRERFANGLRERTACIRKQKGDNIH